MTTTELSWEEAKLDFPQNAKDVELPNKQALKLQSILSRLGKVDPSFLVSFDELDDRLDSFSLACYRLLQAAIPLTGFTIVPDLHGPWCGHQIFHTFTPKVAGIGFPPSFRMLEPSNIEDFHVIAKCLNDAIFSFLCVKEVNEDPALFLELVNHWQSLIQPLIKPKGNPREQELYGMAKLSLANQRPGEVPDGRVAVNTRDFPYRKRPLAIRSIPPREWFPDKVQALKAEQIVSIFPPTELEVFQLFIGRALCGPSGTIPVGYQTPIEHTFRTSLVIKGSAGSGKSQLLHLLTSTMSEFGYSTHTFRDLDGEFAAPDIAPADIAMKDDSSVGDLAALGRSSMFKTMVTGGVVNGARKFQDAVQLKPRGVILLAANEWDSNSAYTTDEGVRSRLRILETLTPAERPEGQLEPKLLVESLAQDAGVSEACIMGWFYRLCLDKFLEAIPTLERTDKLLEAKLQTRVQPSPLRSLVKALKLCLVLCGRTGAESLTPDLLLQALTCFGCLLFDCRSGGVMDVLKADWESNYRDPHHTWSAFKCLRYSSILQALSVAQQSRVNGKLPPMEKFLKDVLPNIATHGSILVGPSPANFFQEWNASSVRNEVAHLFPLCQPLVDLGMFTTSPLDETLATSWFRDFFTPSQVRAKRRAAYAEWQELSNA